jgi:hypothetical protein
MALVIGNGSFDDGIDFLIDEVGEGDIVAGVLVDQPYAQDQHETPYRHRAGQMKYLGEPLMEDAINHVQMIAEQVITRTGSDLGEAMRDVADDMAGYVETRAPLDTGRLRESASPYVRDGGRETYRRPAIAPREADQLPRFRRGN